jgi:hypothetical protein
MKRRKQRKTRKEGKERNDRMYQQSQYLVVYCDALSSAGWPAKLPSPLTTDTGDGRICLRRAGGEGIYNLSEKFMSYEPLWVGQS